MCVDNKCGQDPKDKWKIKKNIYFLWIIHLIFFFILFYKHHRYFYFQYIKTEMIISIMCDYSFLFTVTYSKLNF